MTRSCKRLSERPKDSIPNFRELASHPNRGIRVKVPFVSSTGTTEHLWAEVLSFRDKQMEVRYLTPPVTHNGRLERLHTHAVADLTDWQIELPSGRYAGASRCASCLSEGVSSGAACRLSWRLKKKYD